jgi:hypothetical protein
LGKESIPQVELRDNDERGIDEDGKQYFGAD